MSNLQLKQLLGFKKDREIKNAAFQRKQNIKYGNCSLLFVAYFFLLAKKTISRRTSQKNSAELRRKDFV